MSNAVADTSPPAERPEKRPHIVDSDEGPSTPFPICLEGEVVKGFGRGSGQLLRIMDYNCADGYRRIGHTYC